MALVIEKCQVAPPTGSRGELTLPLTYFDILWLGFHTIRRILFYKLPISKNSFVQTIIPSLKNSLSLALKHYLPLAGNVVCPHNLSGYPKLRYVTGDSVSVIFSETDMNFDDLIGNHPRIAKDFYPFVPQLAEPRDAPGVQLAPVLAIQVTLFPNHGISICFINHHVAGDGASIVAFIRAWASLNKFGGDDQQFLANEFIPFYDRSVVKDPHGLGDLIWGEKKKNKLEMRDIIVTPPDSLVRGTFIIRRDDIQKLKNLILSKRPSLAHVTSFTVTCCYVWTCLIKSEDVIGEKIIDENVMEFFGCAVDCRARYDPPLPSSYFGNCIMGYMAKIRHADLVGNQGFTIAVESIGETIYKRNKDKEYMLTGEWLKEVMAADKHRFLSIAGSPKFDLYAVDFGWGRPEKSEFISLDSDDGLSMSLGKSKDSNGDLEIGLSLPKTRMNAFAVIFSQGLTFLYQV